MTNIMVVDDEATITTQLEERLTSMGYKVVASASSGQEAVQKAKENNPDVILMDIVMPGKIDGIKAADLIKKELDIPVVFLTAYGDEKFIQRAKKVEPFGYIIKPYNENELKAAVEIAIFNKKIYKELKNSEKEWQKLTENIREGIILTDKKMKIVFWNKGAENIFGYDQNEAKGKPLDFILSEGTKKKYLKGLNQLISSGKSEISDNWVEMVGVKKDWSRFPMEIVLDTREGGKNKYFIFIIRDITRQKRIESQMKTKIKEKEILIEDFQERVNQNLSLIYRLLSMQHDFNKSRHPISQKMESHDYIQDMDLVYGSKFQPNKALKVNLPKYIQSITKRLFDSYKVNKNKITLNLNISDIYLNVKTATLCGLIISELVSNSIKHAFPDNRKGKISVCFNKENENQYSIQVKDTGIGFPSDLDFRDPQSRGLEIINDMTSQLNGTIKLKKEQGTEFTVTFNL